MEAGLRARMGSGCYLPMPICVRAVDRATGVAYAEQEGAAHLVVGPTPVSRHLGEGMCWDFFR